MTHDNGQALGPGERDVETVGVQQKLDASGRVVPLAGAHRNDDDGRLLSLAQLLPEGADRREYEQHLAEFEAALESPQD